MKLILIFLSVFALKTCDNTQNSMATKNNDLDGIYHINSITNLDVTNYNLTIGFNEETKQVSGFSGCNRFFGSYTSNENIIKIESLAATKMFCDESANTMETKLLECLSKVDSFTNDNGSIRFLSNKKVLVEAVIEKQSDIISFEYSENSRGKYNHVIIDKKSISVENKRDSNPIVKTCSNANWEILLKSLKTIDIENIPNLKAPSEKRFFDGAAIGTFKISYNGKTYETPSFDHGNPPKEIAELVKEILSISENVE